MSFPLFDPPPPPIPIGAWVVVGLCAVWVAYFGACIAHVLFHEVPLP